jgi:hypothetical protein
MSICLTRAPYSQESFKGSIAKPEDREAAAKAMFGAGGMKRHNMWCSGSGEVICIQDVTVVAGASVTIAVLAGGVFTRVESTELLTMGQIRIRRWPMFKAQPAEAPNGKKLTLVFESFIRNSSEVILEK